MTFDERVRALENLGFSEPQTRFIVTVALHSGFCLRRHYATLTGLKYGAGVRGFLDRLVAHGLARRQDFRRDRGHVYHVHHASIYDSIGQDDNRNRRHTSPALIARKLTNGVMRRSVHDLKHRVESGRCEEQREVRE